MKEIIIKVRIPETGQPPSITVTWNVNGLQMSRTFSDTTQAENCVRRLLGVAGKHNPFNAHPLSVGRAARGVS